MRASESRLRNAWQGAQERWRAATTQHARSTSPTEPGLARVRNYRAQVGQARLAVTIVELRHRHLSYRRGAHRVERYIPLHHMSIDFITVSIDDLSPA
jgi:hypothetical protein